MLILIKLLHTVIWFCLAACVVYLPFAALRRQFLRASLLTGIILTECAILALNRGRCPLTDAAARYTSQRAADFDIYLPLWLAQHNKAFFGAIFLAGETVVLWQWLAAKR